MTLRIPKDILSHLEHTGEAYYPRESCGLLTGVRIDADTYSVENFHFIPNVQVDSSADYLMEPQAMHNIIMSHKPGSFRELVGLWHTHPRNKAIPSLIDLGLAQRSGRKDVPYVITSVEFKHTFAYMFTGEEFVKTELEIV